jgi:DNA-binding transcriptional LysR family regulator
MSPGAEVVVKPLTGPSLRRDITLAWRAGRRLSPAALAFLDLAREMFTAPELVTGAQSRESRSELIF